MARNRNREIWGRAVPLCDAWQQFSDIHKRSKFAEMSNGISAFNASAAHAQNLIDLWKAATDAVQSSSAKRTLECEMRDDLLGELFNANLRAVGYRVSPSASPAPVMIAPDFFDFPDIDWFENTAEYEGKRYVRIKIYDPSADATSLHRRMGRPGSGAAITAAIKELIAEPNSDFCNMPRKPACNLIRQKLQKGEISGNGLSDKNLSKYILEHCQTRQIKL